MQISLWHQCLRRLEAELPEQAFNTWIRPLQAVEDGGRLRLLAPNRYVVDWVNQTFIQAFPAQNDVQRAQVCYSPATAIHPSTRDRPVDRQAR